jgi:hypothetical protein
MAAATIASTIASLLSFFALRLSISVLLFYLVRRVFSEVALPESTTAAVWCFDAA